MADSVNYICDEVRIGRGLPSVKTYIHPAETLISYMKFLFHIMGRLVPAHNNPSTHIKMGPKHFGNSLKSYFFWCKPHWMKATTYTGRKQQFQQALLKTTFKCFFIWFLQCLKQCIVSTSFCNVAACVNLLVKGFRKFYCALTLYIMKASFC